MTPEFLTQEEVARILRVTVATVARRRAKGLIRSIPGRPVLIPAAALAEYLARCEARPPTPAPALASAAPPKLRGALPNAPARGREIAARLWRSR